MIKRALRIVGLVSSRSDGAWTKGGVLEIARQSLFATEETRDICQVSLSRAREQEMGRAVERTACQL